MRIPKRASTRCSPPICRGRFSLTFVGVQTHQAVISEVIRRYALTVNILHGKISHTLNGSFGELYIHAEGNEQQVADMLSLLHERDIAVEVIQHD